MNVIFRLVSDLKSKIDRRTGRVSHRAERMEDEPFRCVFGQFQDELGDFDDDLQFDLDEFFSDRGRSCHCLEDAIETSQTFVNFSDCLSVEKRNKDSRSVRSNQSIKDELC